MRRIWAMEPRRAALFLAVAAFVAAVAYFGAREAGVGSPIEVSGEGGTPEPLTLTLTTASQICETLPAQGYATGLSYQDSEGNWVSERRSAGWTDVSATPVRWAVSGGTPPYMLVIDGETRDAEQTYAGSSGTASVSCALQFGETYIDEYVEGKDVRYYRTQPEVDSGLKTIRATVTDAAGATADASVDVYVILRLGGSDGILKRGKTYRVFGHLITAPADYDVRVGSVTEPNCFGVSPDVRCGPEFRLHLVGANTHLSLFMSDGAEGIRRYPGGDASGTTDALEAALDALVDSVNRRPTVERAAP